MHESNDDFERRLFRANLVAVYALLELAIKKGLVTRDEFRSSCRWFDRALDRIDALALKAVNRDVSHPSPELQALYDEIETRLFANG